jgi:polygalacturonase
MCILCSLQKQPARRRSLLNKMIWTAAWTASPVLAWNAAQADPVLPTISPLVFNVTVSNSSIDGGATAVGNGSTNNTTVLQAFINFASTATTMVNGVTVTGGIVEIPTAASAYLTKELTIDSDVDLQVDSGATLQNSTPTSTLIATNGATTNVAITGSGILNDNGGTSTSSNNMLALSNITNLLVNGVTIENSTHEHLVPEGCNNVTINAVTINDSHNVANTDGIDYSGSNFLIQNCTISDGDDDIVAKPGQAGGTITPCSNILIQNDYITAGHGISIGGETIGGLNNMTVNNITFNSNSAAGGVSNGLRLKAGRGNGGVVTNVSYNNITMINVSTPIQISSWYVNGSDAWPNSTVNSMSVSNAAAASNAAVNSTTPVWQNITFSNITSTGSTSNSVIYGVPESPVQNVVFNNDNLDRAITINYAGYNGAFSSNLVAGVEILMNNTTIAGTLLTSQSQLTNSTFFSQAPNGMYQADVLIAVPEPSCGFLVAGSLALMMRRRRSAATETTTTA